MSTDMIVQAPTITPRSHPRPRAARGWWLGVAGRERARTATRRMIWELGWSTLSPEEIAQRLTYDTFMAQGLGKMLDRVYGSSPYAALHDIFPTLQPWQMGHTPQRYWKGEQGRAHAQAATRWLVEQLGLAGADPQQVAAQLDQAMFDRFGLRGMLEIVYGDSPYAALVDLYPTLLPWQMLGGAPTAYWRGTHGREHAHNATRWLITQLGLATAPPGEVARHIILETFATYGLSGMLSKVYRDSPYAALADIYPDLHPWEMARVPREYWVGALGREHARAAIRWLIAQLGLAAAPPAEVLARIDRTAFERMHLAGMLEQVYDPQSACGARGSIPRAAVAGSPLMDTASGEAGLFDSSHNFPYPGIAVVSK